MSAWIEPIAVNAAVAAIALASRVVRPSAAVGGLVVGLAIYGGAGRAGFAVLLAFFVLGVLLTRLGYREKATRGLAEPHEGRRGSAHAFANAGTAAVLALAMRAWPEVTWLGPAFAGSFAAALSDTAGSEVGQLWGRRPISPLTWRAVPAGTEGAVSAEGTAASAAACLVVGALGGAVGLYGWRGAIAAALGGFAGSTAESLAGSVPRLRRAGHMAFNVGNTVVGAITAAALFEVLGA